MWGGQPLDSGSRRKRKGLLKVGVNGAALPRLVGTDTVAEDFQCVSDLQADANQLPQRKPLPEPGSAPATGRLCRALAVPFPPVQGAPNGRLTAKCKPFSSHGLHSPVELSRRLSLLCLGSDCLYLAPLGSGNSHPPSEQTGRGIACSHLANGGPRVSVGTGFT